jgi:hypothetical protein
LWRTELLSALKSLCIFPLQLLTPQALNKESREHIYTGSIERCDWGDSYSRRKHLIKNHVNIYIRGPSKGVTGAFLLGCMGPITKRKGRLENTRGETYRSETSSSTPWCATVMAPLMFGLVRLLLMFWLRLAGGRQSPLGSARLDKQGYSITKVHRRVAHVPMAIQSRTTCLPHAILTAGVGNLGNPWKPSWKPHSRRGKSWKPVDFKK